MRSEKTPFHASYIDGLRAIAVLSVIVYHLNPKWLPGGFAGVDVFFVISGFVVAISVSGLREIGLVRFLAYFYARRLVRITPALVAVLITAFIASALFIPTAWLSQSNDRTGLFAFFGLSNFVLSSNTGNYFSPVAEYNPFTHTWSLAVEEQFYLVFPWIFIAWLYGRRKLSMWILGGCVAASFVVAIWLGQTDEVRAFYMIWSRFWELGIGVLLFQFMSTRGHSFTEQTSYRPAFAIASDIAFVALMAGLTIARPGSAPFPACVLPVLGTVAVLGFLHGRNGGFAFLLLTRRPMVWIGKISYSLYLWHWPVFVLLRWTTGLEQTRYQIAAIALTFALSVLSYRFIEQPPRRAARSRNMRTLIAAGGALVALGCIVSGAVASIQPYISLSTVVRNAADWYPDVGTITEGDCIVDRVQRKAGNGLMWVMKRTDCKKPKIFAHQVFVIGDSHAMAYSPMLMRFAMNTGAPVYSYNNGGCPFMDFMPWHHGTSERCAAFGDAAVADILPRIKPGDVVFLPSLRLLRMVDQSIVFGEGYSVGWMKGEEAKAGREAGIERAVPVLREFAARGAKVVFEGPTPMLETIPFRCADWFNRNNPICAAGYSVPRHVLDGLRTPVLETYGKIQAAIPGVAVWDPFPLLCPGAECSAFRGSEPLFFDGDHLSGYSNRMMLPSFTAFITGEPAR